MAHEPAWRRRGQLETLRGLVTTATQRLLGDTIAVSDEDWRAPSRLPEWTRGHVATHLARQADGMVRLAEWARTGERQEMYASPEHREAEIEDGAGRSGLELQIDLDTSAGRLTEAFEALDEAGLGRHRRDARRPAGAGSAAAPGPAARGGDPPCRSRHRLRGPRHRRPTAEWLLEWCAFRLRNRDEFPRLDLISDSGFTITVGSAGEPITISGTSANLLGWLMNRVDASAVQRRRGPAAAAVLRSIDRRARRVHARARTTSIRAARRCCCGCPPR